MDYPASTVTAGVLFQTDSDKEGTRTLKPKFSYEEKVLENRESKRAWVRRELPYF